MLSVYLAGLIQCGIISHSTEGAAWMREEWDLEQYDKWEIHREAVDERGHSSWIRVRIPDWWAGVLEEFAESKDFPEYRTKSDILRDALYHRMRAWKGKLGSEGRPVSPSLHRALLNQRALTAMAEQQDRIAEYERFIHNLDEISRDMVQHESWRELLVLTDTLDDIAREAFDGPHLDRVLERITYWRKRADKY